MFESYQANVYLTVCVLASLGLITAHCLRLALVRVSPTIMCLAALAGLVAGGVTTRLVTNSLGLAVPKNANAEISYALEAIRTGKCDPERDVLVSIVGSSKTNVHVRADSLEAFLRENGIPTCVFVFAEGGSDRFERRDYIEKAIVKFSIPIDVIFFESTSTHHSYLIDDKAFFRNSETLRIRDIEIWPMYKELFLWLFSDKISVRQPRNPQPMRALQSLIKLHISQIINLGLFHSAHPMKDLSRKMHGRGAGQCEEKGHTPHKKLKKIIFDLEEGRDKALRDVILETYYHDLEIAISRASPDTDLVYFTTPTNSPKASRLDTAFCKNGSLKERCLITPSVELYKQLSGVNRWKDSNHMCPDMIPIYTAWYFDQIARQLRELEN